MRRRGILFHSLNDLQRPSARSKGHCLHRSSCSCRQQMMPIRVSDFYYFLYIYVYNICINYTSSRMQRTRHRRCDSVAAAQLYIYNIYTAHTYCNIYTYVQHIRVIIILTPTTLIKRICAIYRYSKFTYGLRPTHDVYTYIGRSGLPLIHDRI